MFVALLYKMCLVFSMLRSTPANKFRVTYAEHISNRRPKTASLVGREWVLTFIISLMSCMILSQEWLSFMYTLLLKESHLIQVFYFCLPVRLGKFSYPASDICNFHLLFSILPWSYLKSSGVRSSLLPKSWHFHYCGIKSVQTGVPKSWICSLIVIYGLRWRRGFPVCFLSTFSEYV